MFILSFTKYEQIRTVKSAIKLHKINSYSILCFIKIKNKSTVGYSFYFYIHQHENKNFKRLN